MAHILRKDSGNGEASGRYVWKGIYVTLAYAPAVLRFRISTHVDYKEQSLCVLYDSTYVCKVPRGDGWGLRRIWRSEGESLGFGLCLIVAISVHDDEYYLWKSWTLGLG